MLTHPFKHNYDLILGYIPEKSKDNLYNVARMSIMG
jgi:hypothetical protein